MTSAPPIFPPMPGPVARLIAVTDSDDERLAPYLDIRERDLRGRGDRFVAEGEVVLRVALTSSRFAIESILLSERRVEGLAELLPLAPPDVPVMVVSQKVMDAVVGFHIHRGVLAIGRRLPEVPAAELLASLPHPSLVLGLVGVSNHDNVGGIFRNAAAFGVGAVLIDGASCDPLYRKAIRVSVGGSLKVPFARVDDAAEMLRVLRAGGFAPVALSPRGERRLEEVPAERQHTALLLGAEGPGLPDEVMAACETVRIDMAAGFDSLNVATTTGIALYALTRAR